MTTNFSQKNPSMLDNTYMGQSSCKGPPGEASVNQRSICSGKSHNYQFQSKKPLSMYTYMGRSSCKGQPGVNLPRIAIWFICSFRDSWSCSISRQYQTGCDSSHAAQQVLTPGLALTLISPLLPPPISTYIHVDLSNSSVNNYYRISQQFQESARTD